jgi:hypothetical protein
MQLYTIRAYHSQCTIELMADWNLQPIATAQHLRSYCLLVGLEKIQCLPINQHWEVKKTRKSNHHNWGPSEYALSFPR